MSYTVIARKWRPRAFAEMTGQDHVTRTLANALRSGKTAHAYLFHGPRGVGKTTAARILAKAVNCERGVSSDPCNECATCLAINRGTSLDVVEMDGASNRGIDEIRELREHVGYAPVSARFKVYIIDEVHMLTEQAFNALLKTLEEPPAHVVFVFATTEVHKVPATILSRCQRFEFRRIPHAAIVQRLGFLAEQEHITVDPGALALMARRAEGCLRDAESLLDQAGAASDGPVEEGTVRQLLGLSPLEELVALLDALGRRDLAATAEQLDRMVSSGMEIDRIGMDLVDVLLELIRVRVGRSEHTPQMLQNAAPELMPADLLRFLSVLQGALQAARQSARPGPLIESAFFRLALMDRSVAIEEVLRSLGESHTEVPFPPPPSPGVTAPSLPAVSPPGGISSDPGDILEAAWRQLTASTRSFVVRATPSWRGETVLLEFGPGVAFAGEAMGKGDRRAEVERALSQAAGRPIRVEIVGASATQEAAPASAVTEEPVIQDIIRRFDGIVVDTRPSREEVKQR